MSALDACEPQVIRALEKDGWQIAQKPHTIPLEWRNVYADFRARHINEDSQRTIVVLEVKCFTDPKADIPDFYSAIGQYHFYRTGMLAAGQIYPLYLALPADAYARFAQEPTMLLAFQTLAVKLVIIDLVKEEVAQWIH
jgi:hypothetical protein